jgi:Flp pilus assembly protein TadD
LHPRYAEGHFNLGNVLLQQRKRGEAVEDFRQALAIKPDYFDAYMNLGSALTEFGRAREAAVYLQQAVRLRPASAEAHNNLGLAFADQGRWGEAEAAYQRSLELRAGYVEALNNLASAYGEQDRCAEAEACYEIALWHQPDCVSAHWNRALCWLQAGEFEKGWAEYEWRWRRKQTPERRLPGVRWRGEAVEGKTILVHTEQGLGDTLQFVRYAAVLKGRGARVILECPGFLIPLLKGTPGIDEFVAEGMGRPGYDFYCPLLSLPGLVGTTVATIPAEMPYLFVDPGLVAAKKLNHRDTEAQRTLMVGVAWQGNPHHPWDHHRSFALRMLAPIAALEGVRLVSLQKGPGSEQVAGCGFRVEEVGVGVEATVEGFVETAAVMKNLDLVISADTATAHLAGGLGVPVWVALSRKADWRWMHRRGDSPWYPTMRLWRQERLDEWEPVFERMAGGLMAEK